MPYPYKEKPLEYWLGRSTDAYLEKKDRLKCLEILASKINKEPEAAAISLDVLGHKLVSPDQDEALLGLMTVDYLMRNCGERVHVRVGKYRFLNQIVKLLTPKYLGSQTSADVKNSAIRMLYIWQRTVKHIPKFKEVYNTLKENGYIKEDPKIPEDDISVIPAPSPRCADFEDEEKSTLLKNLLSSNNPDDLQKANRLIKSYVKSEEEKNAKAHQRRKNLDHALFLCKAVEKMTMDHKQMCLGNELATTDISEKMKTAYDELTSLQSILYSYADELVETNDEYLAEVLSVNDYINKILPAYEDEIRNQKGNKKENSLLMMESEELLILNSPDVDNKVMPTTSNDLDGSLLNNMIESEQAEDSHDVPFIGFDKHMTPVLPRRSGQKTIKLPETIKGSIFETDCLADRRLPEAPKPPTLNDLTFSNSGMTIESIDAFLPTYNSEKDNQIPVSIPEEIYLNPIDIILAENKSPTTILDNESIRILLYRCNNQETKILKYVVCIHNYNTIPLKYVKLKFNTSDKNATVRLQNEVRDLPGFNIFGNQQTINLLLCVQPLGDVKEVDIDFSLTYTRNIEHSVSGNFILDL